VVTTSTDATGTVVYDADCGFCTVSADWLSGRGECAVVPWQQLDLEAAGLTRDEVMSAAYWLGPDGTKRRGARAIAAALRTCGPQYRLLGQVIDLPPVRPLAAVGYGLVARYRYKLPGGTNACRMP
jgi:predicted DCC family thiol-disulfide oxidoreductase YuxK